MRLMMMMSFVIPAFLCAAQAQAQSQPTAARATAPYSDDYFIGHERASYHSGHPLRSSPGAQCTTHRWQDLLPEHTMVVVNAFDVEGRLVSGSVRTDGPTPARPDIMTSDAVMYRWKGDMLAGIDVISRRHGGDVIVAKKVSQFIRDKRGHVIKITTDYTDYTGEKPKTTKYVTHYKRDAQGRIIETSDNTRGRKNVDVFRYSEGGRALELRNINTGAYELVRRYDAADRPLETHSPGTTIPAMLRVYDAAGRIERKETPQGVVIRRWVYDAAGRIARMEWRQEQDTAAQEPAVVEVVYSQDGHIEASCSMGGVERVRFKMAGVGCSLDAVEAEDLGMRCGLSRFRR